MIDLILIMLNPGLRMIKTPIKPNTILINLELVIFSFKKIDAIIRIHMGTENSIAVTSASDK